MATDIERLSKLVTEINRGDIHRKEELFEFLDKNRDINSKAYDILKELMDNIDDSVRIYVAKIIGEAAKKNSEVFEILKKTLYEEVGRRRRYSAYGLGEAAKENPEAFEILKKLVNDKDEFVRGDAVYGLSEAAKENPEAFEILKELVNDESEWVRENVAYGLGRAAKKNNEAFKILKKMMINEKSELVLTGVAYGLEYIFNDDVNTTIYKIKDLLKSNVGPNIFSKVSEIARKDIIRDIFNAYSILLETNEKNLELNLEKAVSIFRTVQQLELGKETYTIYSLLLDFLKIESIEKIMTIDFGCISESFENKKFNEVYGRELKVLENLKEIKEILRKYEQESNYTYRIRYLGDALGRISRNETFVRENLHSFESLIFQEILAKWRIFITNAIESLRGSAKLSITPRTRELAWNNELPIFLNIKNEGVMPANNIKVEITKAYEYRIIEGSAKIEKLDPGKEKSVNFVIAPISRDKINVMFTIQYNDPEGENEIGVTQSINFLKLIEFKEITSNPYITGRPLTPGTGYFIERNDIFEKIKKNFEESKVKSSILLYGMRRTGKTSILKFLHTQLSEKYILVFINMEPLRPQKGLDSLFRGFSTEIAEKLREKSIEIELPSDEEFGKNPSRTFKEFLEVVETKIEDKYLVLMIDEFEHLDTMIKEEKIDAGVLSFFRDIIQHSEKISIIFCGVSEIKHMFSGYWSVLFGAVESIHVSFLDKENTKKLVREPVKGYIVYEDIAVYRIYELTFGHPELTQGICKELVFYHNREKKGYITKEDVEKIVDDIIKNREGVFNFLWNESLNRNEKIIVTALAKLLTKGDATAVEIFNLLSDRKIRIDKNELYSLIEGLEEKDILQSVEIDNKTYYRFTIDLFRLWVEKKKSLDKVIEIEK